MQVGNGELRTRSGIWNAVSCQKQDDDGNRRCNQTFGFCRYLMRLLELVARKTEMHEVMLTVQHQNADALRMYRRYIRMSPLPPRGSSALEC